MIVVDVNVLAYLLIPGKFTEAAERLLAEDSAWVVPRFGRSELRNILATYLRLNQMDPPATRKVVTPLNRKPGGLMEQSNASLQRGDQG